jgi:hypothetical protein
MRILAITSKQSGVGYHRIMMPLVNMKKDYCLITDTLSEETFEGKFDIVVMNRMLANIKPEQMIEWRKKYGFKFVVDNDDYWHLEPSHILYQDYILKKIPEQIINWIQIADLCTCTHERLAEEIYKHNTNIEILPNAIPYGEEQFILDKKPSNLVRLFWSGSGTHGRDLEILRNPMKRINFPVRTIIAGYNEGEKHIWDNMICAFTNGLKLKPTIYNYNQVTEYMAAYCDSDISLIPLVDSKFNSMKSNLKVLETASKKNPAIVSNVHPYKGFYPACHVNSQKDWYYWIKLLTHDQAARKQYGNDLYEYCNKNFNLHEVNKQRFAIYSKLIGNASN